jgi:uncharacterized membrane protein (DUF485 family)
MNSSGPEPKLKPEVETSVAIEASARWAQAFDSDTFKLITTKRLIFIVPSLLFFSGMFFVLWVMQSSFPTVARYRLYGEVNLSFVFTMAIFPVVWVLGYLFVRYIRREVYPLEDKLHREFRRGTDHD